MRNFTRSTRRTASSIRSIGTRPCADLVGEVVDVEAAHHVHVDAGEECLAGGLRVVRRDAVGEQFVDAGPVRGHDAVEAPLVAKHAREQARIRHRGQAVHHVEGRHHGFRARIHRGLEGREVEVAQVGRGDVGGVVVAPALRGAVAHEVLGGGGHSAGMKSLHPRRGENGAEMGILAEALHEAPPAHVAGEVGHGGVGPVDAHIGGLERLPFGGKPRDARAERRGFGQRHRKLGAEAVQHVEAEQERDTEAALPGKALGAGDVLGVVEVDQRADPARGQIVPVQGLAVGDQVELPDLLVQRHAGEEIVHPRLHIEPLRHAGHGRDPVLALGLRLAAAPHSRAVARARTRTAKLVFEVKDDLR
jgi:hypothetical protein